MTLSHGVRSSIGAKFGTHRQSLIVLSRVVESFRLRAYASLVRLLSPLLSPTRPFQRRLSATVRHEGTTRAAFETQPVVAPDGLTAHPVELEDPTVLDGNVVSYRGDRVVEELQAQPFLERLCIPLESFHFTAIQKLVALNGDVVISAQIKASRLRGSSGLCLDEIGRQLSQLSLLAISACDPERDVFYVATEASMTEFQTHCVADDAFILSGLVRVVGLQAHFAQAEMELWNQECRVCCLSVQYDVLSSWQEVLPSLASS